MIVRIAEEKDLSFLVSLEKECFSMPWKEEDLAFSLNQNWQRVLICEENAVPIGYGLFFAVAGEWQIARLATFLSARRRGVGEMIVRHAFSLCESEGGGEFFLEVRESNLAAIALYSKLGFSDCGKRENYYDKPKENALLMHRVVPGKTGEGS